MKKNKNWLQQNLYAMRAEAITERSVLLARQSSALTFLLNKFKNTNHSFGSQPCLFENYRFSIPHCA
jgi:uncharacterized coiled-coil protein SlyX